MPRFSFNSYRCRRIFAVITLVTGLSTVVIANPKSYEPIFRSKNPADAEISNPQNAENITASESPLASEILAKLEVKGRAPKTGYSRDEFYKNWPDIDGCSLRQRIIKRELGQTAALADDNCTVISGEFDEPYTGAHLKFSAKSDLSQGVQIDHVVSLSDAWQKGAQYFNADKRFNIATDPLNLLAVDAKTNQGKSDGDAATWLPPNKSFRCAYIARQISVKYKYGLWVTEAERDAMSKILATCPNEPSVGIML